MTQVAKRLNIPTEAKSSLEKFVPSVEWDGVVLAESLNAEFIQIRNAIADAARNYEWTKLVKLVSKQPELINVARLGSTSLYSPLHQAAHAGAPVEVANQLIQLGAWRTLQNVLGERPVDIAEKRGHRHLLEPLTPIHKHHVPIGILLRMQANFHLVVLGRADELVKQHRLRLPELEPLLELDKPEMWFHIPGMYGGFKYWLDRDGIDCRLIAESWCRVAGGSGQRHEISSSGSRLVDEGFV